MAFFLFCFYIDIILCVKERECQSCGSERNDSELHKCRRFVSVGRCRSVSELCGFCC
jgi:hypothetical protein